MKKITAIFLLSVYFITVTQLYELLKVNVLIKHFHETRRHEPGISFVNFLVMHYITDDGNDQDNDRDNQLPFKSNGSLVANATPVFILTLYDEIILTPVVPDKRDFYNYSNSFLTSNFCDMVWNPPRFS